jgi:regulator of protease activity HflC (stomatin/prohibitin superfamily)
MVQRIDIGPYERGLLIERGVFTRMLQPGAHWLFDFRHRKRIDRVSMRDVFIDPSELPMMVRSGALAGHAEVVDLKDHQRALVWVDGRLNAVLAPGLHAMWTLFHEVRVERIDVLNGAAHGPRFEHPELELALAARGGAALLDRVRVDTGQVGLVFQDGRHTETLPSGGYAFWRGEAAVNVVKVDLREQMAEVAGQEILTADRVTLRLNTLVLFRVTDPLRAVAEPEGPHAAALYRQAQLVLREVVGGRDLDALLAGKDEVAHELSTRLGAAVAGLGIEIRAFGIRDVILPGDMREILNRVTSARKAAEAEQVTRREETAAMRSQANTARIFESNPTLMRLRELEVLEKVAGNAKLSIVLGDGGLVERVAKLL